MRDRWQERLIALLAEQRRLQTTRKTWVRDTASWTAATEELEVVNQEIMRIAASENTPRESLGRGLSADLDARPFGDFAFQAAVLQSVRQALASAVVDHLAAGTGNWVQLADERLREATQVIADAQLSLRGDYPAATLSADVDGPATLSIRADRDGRVA